MEGQNYIIQTKHIGNQFGDLVVHQKLFFNVHENKIVSLIGGSGCGKTTLLRNILRLNAPTTGEVFVFGVDIYNCTEKELNEVRQKCGVMFQHNALFSSMTLLENVMFPLNEFTDISKSIQKEIALFKLSLVGLGVKDAYKLPAELSGGMQKRAALARALVLDPSLILLDEPTAGLDPHSADNFDDLLLTLKENLGFSVLMITHDLDTIAHVSDTVAFLGEGHIISHSKMNELLTNQHPLIQSYFSGYRGSRIERMVKQ